MVQLFPEDGTYMWNGIDLLDATKIIPFEMNAPVKLGRLTPNKNPTNFFAEPESISFAPSNVVKGVSFVPDPLLQWAPNVLRRYRQSPPQQSKWLPALHQQSHCTY